MLSSVVVTIFYDKSPKGHISNDFIGFFPIATNVKTRYEKNSESV